MDPSSTLQDYLISKSLIHFQFSLVLFFSQYDVRILVQVLRYLCVCLSQIFFGYSETFVIL